MIRGWPPARVTWVVVLALGWCVLWGSLSIANLLSGTVVAVIVTRVYIRVAPLDRVRVLPLVEFAWLVATDLVRSTVEVSREVLTPTDHTDEAIIGVDLPDGARPHLLLLTIAITVTPGTAVVDIDPDGGTLYIHLLHADKQAEVRHHVRRLARLAVAGLSTSAPAGTGDVLRSPARRREQGT